MAKDVSPSLDDAQQAARALLAAVVDCCQHMLKAEGWSGRRDELVKLGEEDPGDWITILEGRCATLSEAIDSADVTCTPHLKILALSHRVDGYELAGFHRTSVTHSLLEYATSVYAAAASARSAIVAFDANPSNAAKEYLADLPPLDVFKERSRLDSEFITAEDMVSRDKACKKSGKPPKRGSKKDQSTKVDLASQYILDNPYQAKISIADLAKIVGCNSSLLYRKENKREIEKARATARKNASNLVPGFYSQGEIEAVDPAFGTSRLDHTAYTDTVADKMDDAD